MEVVAFSELSEQPKKICNYEYGLFKFVYIDNSGCKVYIASNFDEIIAIVNNFDINTFGLSSIIQNSVAIPPQTIYKDVYILPFSYGIQVGFLGNVISVKTIRETCLVKEFLSFGEQKFDSRTFGELMSNSVRNQFNKSSGVLLHSAGKDSNCIAIALAENGYQNDVEFLSFKSAQNDESAISKKIAYKLGFKHHTISLSQNSRLNFKTYRSTFEEFYQNVPFFTFDMLPLMAVFHSNVGLTEKTIFDGMGNDFYMGHIPSRREIQRYLFTKYLPLYRLPLLRRILPTKYKKYVSSPTECMGFPGLTYADAIKLFPQAENTFYDVNGLFNQGGVRGYIENRANIRGLVIDTLVFSFKSINAASVYNAEASFPWVDKYLVNYMNGLAPNELYDLSNYRNKLCLRTYLKQKLGLDSDQMGKMPAGFKPSDFYSEEMLGEIFECESFSSSYIRKMSNDKEFISEIYFLALWLNRNKYAQRV
ncbi:hypothetical protein [Marinobacter sp. CHS3-4]|uniref:hypothetical protein n=1 Tax=Marinobacter sp. CHS3-4 TaxID=3045174 RepID=UPI0024B59D0E|nr:hypothetical protein [Marinobacter sp. CHS3-4]MDI9244991.1 hypothetical protein [Marinobacter sp. CHS3-4]